jgi:hypothetical protein
MAAWVDDEWVWQDGLISGDPNDPNEWSVDPAIAYNSISGDFVVVSLARPPLGIAHALPLSGTGEPFPNGWTSIDPNMTVANGDKCWIAAGEMTQQVQEFYVVYNPNVSDLGYYRSTDGGYTWAGDYIRVNNTVVTGMIGSDPAGGRRRSAVRDQQCC